MAPSQSKGVLIAGLIMWLVVFGALIALTAKVMMPREYIQVCFQKLDERYQFGVAVPAELCTAKDKIVKLEVKK